MSPKQSPNNKKQKQQQQLHEQNTSSQLIQHTEKIMAYLNPVELANMSLTCKHLHKASQLITQYRISDVSRGLENTPIPFINNTTDRHPPYAYLLYTTTSLLQFPHSSRQYWGPHVRDGKEFDFDCPCLLIDGDDDDGVGVVGECGPRCGLSRGGFKVKVKVVWDERKGWCLVAAQGIRKGQFLCSYAGELLTTEEARKRQQLYDELSLGGGFSSALLVIREHLPSRKACLRINIDATRIGNAARFINHSCDGGNLTTVLVRSSGALVPRLCFFASRDIQEDEELTFSYGDIRVRSKGLPCYCGSKCCFGTLPSEHT